MFKKGAAHLGLPLSGTHSVCIFWNEDERYKCCWFLTALGWSCLNCITYISSQAACLHKHKINLAGTVPILEGLYWKEEYEVCAAWKCFLSALSNKGEAVTDLVFPQVPGQLCVSSLFWSLVYSLSAKQGILSKMNGRKGIDFLFQQGIRKACLITFAIVCLSFVFPSPSFPHRMIPVDMDRKSPPASTNICLLISLGLWTPRTKHVYSGRFGKCFEHHRHQ